MNIPETKFIWMNGKFVRWHKAKVSVLSHVIHYGSGLFEGVRVYETADGPAIRLLKDHVDRFFYSAKCLNMKLPYTKKQFAEAIVDTVRKNKLKQGYVRPFAFFGYGKMGVNPVGAEVNVCIACWPWGAYLPEKPIPIRISPIIRIHPQSCKVDAKISGYYVNNIMAIQSVVGPGCREALLLDYKGNIAEGPGEHFYIVKKGVIYTTPLGTVLDGITRRSVLQIARDLGYTVKEKLMKPKEAYAADEAFFTGTAAEVTWIGSIDGKKINKGKKGSVTQHLRDAYMDAVYGRNPKYKKWLTVVDL